MSSTLCGHPFAFNFIRKPYPGTCRLRRNPFKSLPSCLRTSYQDISSPHVVEDDSDYDNVSTSISDTRRQLNSHYNPLTNHISSIR